MTPVHAIIHTGYGQHVICVQDNSTYAPAGAKTIKEIVLMNNNMVGTVRAARTLNSRQLTLVITTGAR